MKKAKKGLYVTIMLLFALFTPFKHMIAQSANNMFMVSINIKDSLLKISKSKDKAKNVTTYLNTAINLGYSKSDSAIILLNQAEILAKEINSTRLFEKVYLIYSNIENIYTGNYISALYHAFYALNYRKINLDQNLKTELNSNTVWSYKTPYNDLYYMLSYIYAHLGNKEKSLEYLNKIDVVPDPEENLFTEDVFANFLNSMDVFKERFRVYCCTDTKYLNILKQNAMARNPKTGTRLSHPLPIKYSFTILGKSGIRRGDTFNITGIPRKYEICGLFQVTEVEQTIQDMKWLTRVQGEYRQQQ